MRVSLFVTCLIDQFWPEAGLATVEVLRRAGCEVDFDARQTCCAQPAFNAGYRREAQRVARAFLDVFGEAEAVVVPSGSCAAMIRHLPELFPDEDALRHRAERVAARTHELGTFLVGVLGKTSLGARFRGRVTWHDACHGLRDLGIHDGPRALIREIEGAELVELEGADACCGFGGKFSVQHPELSAAIADRKLEAVLASGVDAIVSGDVGCLMQLGGRLARRGSSIRALHLAELLAAR